jgi:PAS domain S-box-containing protein
MGNIDFCLVVGNMGKVSEKHKEIERFVDQLKIPNAYSNSTASQINQQDNQPLKQCSETLVMVNHSPIQKQENIEKNQQMNNDKKSDITTNVTEKYRLIALETSDLIAFTTFDANPVYTFISPSHKKILGYDEKDMLGKSGLDFIHEDDIQSLVEILLTYLEVKINNSFTSDMLSNAKNIDFRIRDKAGQWHYLRSTVNIVKNELLFISKDISEHKKAQEALAESERRYRTLYSNLRDGFAAIDLSGKIAEWNPAFVSMLGYSTDEIIQLTYEDITPVKWHDFERRILDEQVKKRGYSDLYEKEYIHKDGTIFPIELQTYAIYDNHNQLCGFWAFIRDITIRKKMDSEQKENQERIKAIVLNAPIGIAVSDRSRHFISANDAFCKILGYTENELQKMTFRDITHIDDLKESNNKIDDLNSGKISYFTQEKRYVKKDKSVIIGKVTVSAMRNQEDSPCLYIAELEDITDPKRMDEALKKSEEKFVKAFRSSPVAIAVTRISDGRFLEVNKSLEKLIGYTRDELLSNTTIGLNIWADTIDRKNLFEELAKIGSVYDHEYRFRSKNGNVILTRYSGEVIDFSGEQCVLSVLIDITEYKKAHELLQESEEKYRSIVENTQDIIMLTSPDSRVGYISPACFTVLGHQPDDLIGKIPEIFYPDDIEKVKTALSKALQGTSGANLEYRIVTKNKAVRWVSHSWSPIFSENHKLRYVVSIIRDITNTKDTEQNLKIKIEELEKYKSVTVNREVKMVELKNEINELLKQLNQKPKYPSIEVI